MTEAYVTLVATDAYASGALVLSHKLRSLGSEKEIVCLVTPNITDRVKDILSKVCLVISVNTIRSTDFDNLDLLGRPELDITFTKFHVWRLTQYSKIVFLDADTCPLKNIDELFDWPSFSAAPDAGWPDCFNSGVFVTEPSETIFNDLTALASEKGSFDGGDQGLLNSYFSSWSTTPSQRLPFTFNTTPTAQYGYAPAHNQFGHNISILHFIGQNKPWKYQRFADGRILPLGGNAWEGLKDMVQEWWNTWDEHYGRTPPYHLLSGEFDHQLGFDSGFQTHPIVPFDEPVKNAWEDQKIDFHDERRHVQPMPPISNISIKHPEWIKEYDIIQKEHEPYYQTQKESQHFEQHHHDNHHHDNQHHEGHRHDNRQHGEYHHDNNHHENHHHENHDQKHHHTEEHKERNEGHNHCDDSQNQGEKSNHHEYHQTHSEESRHHEHQHHQEEQNHFNNEDKHDRDEGNNHENNQHHHEEHHKKEKIYSMIEWNPAYQDPPKTGYLGADIPDLSYFKNVWDGPVVQQHRRLWVAPAHQPEPGIMKKPEYSNYSTEDYNSEILYPRKAQQVPEEHHLEVTHQEHHIQNHQHESHQEEPHHYEEPQHFEKHHHLEPIYPPVFPWDNVPDHFPPPTRVWVEEHTYHWPGEAQNSDDHLEQHHEQQQEQQEQIPQVDEVSQDHESHVHDSYVEEESQKEDEIRKEVDHSVQQEHTEITVDEQEQEEVQTEIVEESAIEVGMEQVPESVEREENTRENQNEQGLFAIDQVLTPSAQLKIDEFIAALAADDHDGLDYSDRDLIPINFKSSSRLQSGMYTPSPITSRVVSRNGSRSNSRNNSRSNSRRSSIASSRRNSISAIKKPATDITAPVAQDVEQPSKLFAGESSIYSRKTPYTSAAVTPAAIATPEEIDRDTYFNDDALDVDQGADEEEFLKPDFLEPTLYSLSDSLDFEGEAEIDDWDPMKALNKLREHSESMVLRQSLHEALIKTAMEQERESEFLEYANEPVVTQPKRPTAFKSSWDDEEYELPSGIVSGQSSPRTPVVRTLSSNLTAEIEMEKERHKQQRASLMLAQPQAALASTLEAELDLSEGTLFKRRHYESSDTGTEPISSPPETIATFVDDETTVEDKTAYYDDSVVKEAQRKLMELLSGEGDQDKTEPIQVPLPIAKESKQISSTTIHVSHESKKTESSFADFMLNRKSHFPNFGFEVAYKFPTHQSIPVAKDSVENVKSMDAEESSEKDFCDSIVQVSVDTESFNNEEDLKEEKAVAAAIALLSGVEEITSTVNENSTLSATDEDLKKAPITGWITSENSMLVADKHLDDSEVSITEAILDKSSESSTQMKDIQEAELIAESRASRLKSVSATTNGAEYLISDATLTSDEPSNSIAQVVIDANPIQNTDVNTTEETSLTVQTTTADSKENEHVESINDDEASEQIKSNTVASILDNAETKNTADSVSVETSVSTNLDLEHSVNELQSYGDNRSLVKECSTSEEKQVSKDLHEDSKQLISDDITKTSSADESSKLLSNNISMMKQCSTDANELELQAEVKEKDVSKLTSSDDAIKASVPFESSGALYDSTDKIKQPHIDTNSEKLKVGIEEQKVSQSVTDNATEASSTNEPFGLLSNEAGIISQSLTHINEQKPETIVEEHKDSKQLVTDNTTEASPTNQSSDLISTKSVKEQGDSKQLFSDNVTKTLSTDECSDLPSKEDNNAINQSLTDINAEEFKSVVDEDLTDDVSLLPGSITKGKIEDKPAAESANLDKSAQKESFKSDAKKTENSAIKQASFKALPSKPITTVAPAAKGKTSNRRDSASSIDTKNIPKKPLTVSTEKGDSGVKSATVKKTARNSGEFTRVERKSGSFKNVGSSTGRDDTKGKDAIGKDTRAREPVRAEKSSTAAAKATVDKNANKHFPTTRTISKRSSEPILKPLPAKPIATGVKNDKSAKAPATASKPAQDQRSIALQASNATTTRNVKSTTTKTLRNRTSAPVLKLSQDSLVTPKASRVESKTTAKPPTPTRAAFATRSATPPSPPPKSTTQSRATSLNRQSSSTKSPVLKTPASPVKTTFPSARQPSPVKTTFTTARQPSPTKPTFASKAALAIKSVTGNKPLAPSRKELPPRASIGSSKPAQKKSPVLPVRSNSKSSIATPVTSATSVVSEEPVLAKSLPDSPTIFSDKSIFSKRSNSKKGKERVSPTSSVISIARTPKPKAVIVTSPKAQLADHHHSREDHSIKAISKQLPALETHKDTYASVTKAHATLGEHHHASHATVGEQHHASTSKDRVDKQNTQKSHSSVALLESVRSRQSSTSSTSFTITETASITSEASSSTRSLSFTRRGSSSSSIAATNVSTATATLSPTASTSSSRKSARERISSFVKGTAFKKSKKIPEEK